MNVFVAPGSGDSGKFVGVAQAFPGAWRGSVLDVGSRTGRLHAALGTDCTHYLALDLAPPANIVAHLERGLPFAARSFDTVVALDVLEHTDDIHRSLAELCRVAGRYVVLSLPNAYEVRLRARYLRGLPPAGKYCLPLDAVADRHRWLFSHSEAARFCEHNAARAGFRLVRQGALVGPNRARRLPTALIGALPDLLSPTYLALLQRTSS